MHLLFVFIVFSDATRSNPESVTFSQGSFFIFADPIILVLCNSDQRNDNGNSADTIDGIPVHIDFALLTGVDRGCSLPACGRKGA